MEWRRSICWGVAATLLLSGMAQGLELYRCRDDSGTVSFQQMPCAGSGQRMSVGEAQAVWSSLRPGERNLVESYRRRDRERLARQRAAEREALRTQGQHLESSGCFNKRHALEKVEAHLRHGYRAGQGERLRRRRDYLEEYLRRYCR